MRTLLIGTAVVVTLVLIGSHTLGQEAIATPNPVAEAQAGGVDAGDPAQPPVAKGPDSWRYRWQDGRWWYVSLRQACKIFGSWRPGAW